jgi:gliding motility-associated-like protein
MKWTFKLLFYICSQIIAFQQCFGQISVSAGDDLFICAGESAQLQGLVQPEGTPFAWTILQGDPNSINEFNILNPEVTPNFTTTYVLTASNEAESATDTVVVNVNLQPVANAGDGGVTCGLVFNLLAEPSFGTGAWSSVEGGINFNEITNASTTAIANNAGTFQVIWTETNFGCVDADTISVTLLPGPVQPKTEFKFCSLTDSIEFENIPYPFTTIFEWEVLGNAPITLSSSTIAEPSIISDEVGDFELVFNQTVPDSGCDRSDTISIRFLNHQEVNILNTEDTLTVCRGERRLLNFGGTGTLSFFPSNFIEQSSESNAIIRPIETGYFRVTRTQGFCSSSDSLFINSSIGIGLPPAFETDYFCNGVRFIAVDTNSFAVRSTWIFEGDTLQSAPIFEKGFNSTISITLLSEDETGCLRRSEGSSVSGSLANVFDFNIPNVFTPNGDGVNDVFTLGDNLFLNDCAEMFIYNRYGNLIFSSNGGLPVWDGFDFTGQRVPTGTYFYVIKFPDSTIKGTLSLFR